MAKICNNKKYRTRDGRVVVINRKRAKGSCFPVRGRINRGLLGYMSFAWTADGRHYPGGYPAHRFDLIEVEK